ncbi:MAG: hypothetical protein L0H70_07510, partial [Xanthomonadales bacterium]|nr:hypothetical protein [Xanthomonadales bacterium]
MNRYVCAALLPLLFVSSWVFAGPAAWTGQGPFGGMVNRVVVDPMVPSRLYATTRNGFFRSVDGGLSWQRAETGLLQPEPIRAVIALDPNVANALWLVDDAGRLYRSTDAAAHWSPTGDVAPGGVYTVTDLIAVNDAPGVLYESSYSNGLRKSVDGGAAFNTLDTTVDGHVLNIFTHLAADPTDPARLIATSTTDCAPGSPQTPVYRSIDAGASWAAVSVGGCNGGYHGNYTQIVFAPAGSDRVYALLDSMLFRSNDAGASFAATGLSANAVAVSPASADVLWLASVIYSSYESGFILQKSADGGTSATTFTTGLSSIGSAVPSVVSIAIHP